MFNQYADIPLLGTITIIHESFTVFKCLYSVYIYIYIHCPKRTMSSVEIMRFGAANGPQSFHNLRKPAVFYPQRATEMEIEKFRLPSPSIPLFGSLSSPPSRSFPERYTSPGGGKVCRNFKAINWGPGPQKSWSLVKPAFGPGRRKWFMKDYTFGMIIFFMHSHMYCLWLFVTVRCLYFLNLLIYYWMLMNMSTWRAANGANHFFVGFARSLEKRTFF